PGPSNELGHLTIGAAQLGQGVGVLRVQVIAANHPVPLNLAICPAAQTSASSVSVLGVSKSSAQLQPVPLNLVTCPGAQVSSSSVSVLGVSRSSSQTHAVPLNLAT